MTRLAVLGASGHGKVVADAAVQTGWDEVCFFDDAWPGLASNGHWPVKGNGETLLNCLTEYDGVVVAVGDNGIRQKKLAEFEAKGARIASIIHPSAMVSDSAELGPGSVVFANAVINAGAMVGAGAIVNTGAVVEHDCHLGECVHVSPNATLAGGVNLGQLVWVGANACVRQLVSVGDGVLIGMGSVVLRDIPPGQVMAGNPARPI